MSASGLFTYGTSYHALKDRAALKPGETLLILGAARDAGADRTLIYPVDDIDPRALTQMFKDACPNGADVIYDAVGGSYAEPAFRTINWEGRYLVVGFPAGIPKIPLNLPLLKSAQLVGVFWGAAVDRDPVGMNAEMAEVLKWIDEGMLAPAQPTIYPLERGGEAIAALAVRHAIGKLVVKI